MSFTAAVVAEASKAPVFGMEPWVLGVVVLCVFAALAFVTWTYRDVANRHSHKAEADAAQHAGAPGAYHHGAGHPSSQDH